MGDTKAEFTEAAKAIIGIKDNESDAILTLLAEDTVEAVLAYCHIDVLPRQLEGFIPIITAKRFADTNAKGVKAISEGERRVEYGDTKDDFLSEYESRLKPFKSREAWLPSELGDSKNDKSV